MAEQADSTSAVIALEKRFEDATAATNQRFDAVHQRFDAMDKRLDDMTAAFNQRLDDMTAASNQRFDDFIVASNQRFDDLITAMNQRIGRVETQVNALRNTYARQLWTMIALVAGIVVAGVVKFWFLPGGLTP